MQDRALALARQGKSPEEIVEFLGQTLMNKLLHAPTRRLRQAGEHGETDMLQAAHELFDLSRDD